MFPERLESERLTFEYLSQETVDVFELYDLLGHNSDAEEVFEYLETTPHDTLKETFDKIRTAGDAFDDGEWVQYAIRPKVGEEYAGDVVGLAGLYPKWERRFATLGIVLDRRVWGNGYSAERAELFVELAFERLDLDLVAVMYIDGNEKSRRAIEKYVDRFDGQYEGLLRRWLAGEDDVYDCHRYTISKTEYERSGE